MNLIILTLTLYLQLLITRVSTLPLARSKRAKALPSTELDSILRIFKQKSIKSIMNVSHPVFLHTRHTRKFVKVTSNKISALSDKTENKYAELLLTTRGLKGELSIQGKHSKKYVCMNNRGRVILKKSFNKRQCLFYMKIHENGYYTFRSVNNEKWFLGFKKSGETKLGHKTKYDHTAAWMMIERPERKR